MSETRACPECKGTGRVASTLYGVYADWAQDCGACHGSGRVWEPDSLREGEKANERYVQWGEPGAMGRTAHQEVVRTHEVAPGPGASRTVHFHKDGP